MLRALVNWKVKLRNDLSRNDVGSGDCHRSTMSNVEESCTDSTCNAMVTYLLRIFLSTRKNRAHVNFSCTDRSQPVTELGLRRHQGVRHKGWGKEGKVRGGGEAKEGGDKGDALILDLRQNR